ncbi:MAG TPA: hypothetical protein V6C72_20170, partial [Chroococcales cyanobacterium]
FRTARGAEEQSARQVENSARAARGLEPLRATDPAAIESSSATNGQTYGQIWRQEFERFKESGGSVRPAVDYNGVESGAPNFGAPGTSDSRVIETIHNEVPEDWWFGKVGSELTRADGSKVYRLAEGNPEYGLQPGDTVEWYPNSVKAHLTIDGVPHVVEVETVMHGRGSTAYISPDGEMYLAEGPEQPVYSDSAESPQVIEPHQAVGTNIGDMLKINPESHVAQPDESFTLVQPGERITALEGQNFYAQPGATVFAENGSHVIADAGSTVHAYEGSNVAARPGSIIKAYFGSNIVASDGANIERFGGTTVMDRAGHVSPNFQRSPLSHRYFGR